MTSPGGINQYGFISTSRVRETGVDWPDIQLYFFCLSTYSQFAKDISHIAFLDPKHLNSIMEPLQGFNTFVMAVTLVRPKSVGEIRLRNRDPFSPPIIDPHYLEHPDDVQTLKEGSVQPELQLLHRRKNFACQILACGFQEYNLRWILLKKRTYLKT